MAERTIPFFGIGNADEPTDPFRLDPDLDLDWELQRLLGEELNTMEPEDLGPGSRIPEDSIVPKKADAAASSPTNATAGAAPRSAASSSPAPAEPQPRTGAKNTTASKELDPATSAMAQNLSVELDTLYQQMTRLMGTHKESFDDVANLLQRARESLLDGPTGVVEAEKLARQAQGILKRKEDSRRWASSYGVLLLMYEFIFFGAYIVVLAFDGPLAAYAGAITGVTSATTMSDILPFWDTMVWGGIGGVLGSLYSLYWHVAVEQDFDRQYNMWYVVQPVMGAMLGALVYLIVISGLLAIGTNVPSSTTWFPAALACLCGFRQKFILELLDKLMEVIGLRPLWNSSAPKTASEN